MSSIYNFLSNVWQEIRLENKQHKAFLPFLLVFITLPTSRGLNNVLLALFVVSSFYFYRNSKLKFSAAFWAPMLLFLWMALSYFWSIEAQRTLKALPKEITLLLVPFVFYYIPAFTKDQKHKIFTYYSYTIVLYVSYFFLRAVIRFLITKETSVFFYHGPDNETDTGLVPRLLNAIHFSVYVALAFFHFFTKSQKTNRDRLLALFLFAFVVLLSSKNIIFIMVVLILIQVLFYSKTNITKRLRNVTIMFLLLGTLISFSKIKDRFLIEFASNTNKKVFHNTAETGVNNISIYEAWNTKEFTSNDYFPGTAFRVYQIRLFLEFMAEEPIFWNGFGFNASQPKLVAKEQQYHLYPGYGSLNFHNQYVQNFAELGAVGFVLLLIILIINIKNAVRGKDFMHIAFAVLMISLFLTESFLWRQRGITFFMLLYGLYNCNDFQKVEKD